MPSMARLTDSGCSDCTVCLPHWLSAATNAIQADVSSSRCRLAVVGFNISGYSHIEKLGEKPPSGQATSLAHIFFTSMYVCVCVSGYLMLNERAATCPYCLSIGSLSPSVAAQD